MTVQRSSFFAYETDRGYVLSIAEGVGRKNYSLESPQKKNVESSTQILPEAEPLAVESFALNPEHYHSLMNRIDALHQQ